MAGLRESSGLQQLELVGFFSVDGLLAPQQPQNSDFPSDFSELPNRTVEVGSEINNDLTVAQSMPPEDVHTNNRCDGREMAPICCSRSVARSTTARSDPGSGVDLTGWPCRPSLCRSGMIPPMSGQSRRNLNANSSRKSACGRPTGSGPGRYETPVLARRHLLRRMAAARIASRRNCRSPELRRERPTTPPYDRTVTTTICPKLSSTM
jgi:hypothetical protein